MTDNHGEMPTKTTTDWKTPESKQAKKKAYQDKVGAFIEKSKQNDPPKPKMGAVSGFICSPCTPLRETSNFITRINFKVVPQKITKALSVLYNTITIMAAIQAADPLARMIAVDHEGNEKTFYGAKTVPPENKETQDFIKQFIEEPRITNRNELVGLFTIRSEISFRDIKKKMTTKQLLNELPRIFLTQNNLSVVTPVLVGFFVNHYPRPDKPEVFESYINQHIKEHNENIQYQVEFGPIWAAKNRKMTVHKLMTSQEDKEQMRSIMGEHDNARHGIQYICASEYYSLSDQDKSKIVLTQLEFMNTTRSIFIEGYKTVLNELRMDVMNEKDDEDINEDEDKVNLATWIMRREASNGEYMFTRIHEAVHGLVELYTTPGNHKEAIDWARLAMSEIAKELNDKSMEATFISVAEAENALATQPDWTPHTLAKRIENLAPSDKHYQPKRRPPVAISYATANSEKEATEQNATKSKRVNKKGWNNTSAPNSTSNQEQATAIKGNAWMLPSREDTQDEQRNSATTPTKQGTNKYKAAAEAQEARIGKIEEKLDTIVANQHPFQENKRIDKIQQDIESMATINSEERFDKLETAIVAIAKSQRSTTEMIKSVATGQGDTRELVKKINNTVRNNKIQADQDHKIMTEAMKSFQDSLVASQTMIVAMQRDRESRDNRKQERESPIRKKRAIAQKHQEMQSDNDSDDSSFNSSKTNPQSEVTTPNKSFKSNAEMDSIAGEA